MARKPRASSQEVCDVPLTSSASLLRKIGEAAFNPPTLRKLTLRHQQFVRAYVVGFGPDGRRGVRFNGAAAALACGYSERNARNTAMRLLAKDQVCAAIAELVEAEARQQHIDAQEVVRRLDEIYARCMQAIPVTDKDGRPNGVWRFFPSGAVKACELLGRYLGMWRADGEVHVSVTLDQARDFARGFARRVLTLIEEHVSVAEDRERLVKAIGQEALRDG